MESLQIQFAKNLALRRKIMRRIWYVFALSVIWRPAMILGVIFGASAIAFWRLVSITSIAQNLLRVPLGEVPGYTLRAMTEADIMTLLSFVLLMTISVIVVGKIVGQFLITTSQSAQTARGSVV